MLSYECTSDNLKRKTSNSPVLSCVSNPFREGIAIYFELCSRSVFGRVCHLFSCYCDIKCEKHAPHHTNRITQVALVNPPHFQCFSFMLYQIWNSWPRHSSSCLSVIIMVQELRQGKWGIACLAYLKMIWFSCYVACITNESFYALYSFFLILDADLFRICGYEAPMLLHFE